MQQNNPQELREGLNAVDIEKLIGFKLIRTIPSIEVPPDAAKSMAEALASLATLNPSDLESMVVVVRSKSTVNDQAGFSLQVTSIGPSALLAASALLVKDKVFAELGGSDSVANIIAEMLQATVFDDKEATTVAPGNDSIN